MAAFSLAMVPVVFWPIGKRHNETLAMGFKPSALADEAGGVATTWRAAHPTTVSAG